MMARTLSGLNPKAEQRRQSALLDRLSIKYERRIAREIARSMREAANRWSSDDSMAVDLAMFRHKEEMSKILNSLWYESGQQFSEQLLGVAKSRGRFERKDVNQVNRTEVMDRFIASWVASHATLSITQITDTTKDDINRIIQLGVQDGLSEREIGKMIRSIAPTKSASRAQTIARTETHQSAQAAVQEAAQATGLDMKRQWVSADQEGRTREDHMEAGNQKPVGMYEPFTVGDFKLMYPGDSSLGAPASQTINCRCSVVFVLD
jgi:hypothetical protein